VGRKQQSIKLHRGEKARRGEKRKKKIPHIQENNTERKNAKFWWKKKNRERERH